jgi:hypothetical protein
VLTDQWCAQQDNLSASRCHENADQRDLQEGVILLAMAQSAQHLFDPRPAEEKRRL